MRLGALGPLRVEVAGRPVHIPSRRQRAVLAVLILSANRTVSSARVIDAVWGERPAASASNLVRTYVWRLRGLLTENGESRVLTRPAGYLLRVEAGELDLEDFERLLDEGRAALAAGDTPRAAESLTLACELWRGEPFADVTLHDGLLATEVARLTEARTAALEERIEACLALGDHDAIISELIDLTTRHPLRERLAGQLMLACHRSGRRAEALAAFRRLRAETVGELGLEPGHEVTELHQRILQADPELLVGGMRRRAEERIVPRQLPAVSEQFAGRADELSALTALMGQRTRAAGTVVVSAIDGGAGIGKSTLALYWGTRNVARFPDGQLFVNLRGFAPGTRTMDPAEAVRRFLDALGVAPGRVPPDPDAQADLYRSLLASRRMLVVLDNARDTDQVRPLLPGSPTCLTIVTSRNPLTGLIAAEAARPITLDLLTDAEALDLLTQRIGAERIEAEPEAAARLVELCARLPLALSIAAAQARLRPAFSLGALADQIQDAGSRLDALDIEDSTTDLRAVFSWSYRHLAAPVARMFRLLGVHPGPDISVRAAASLAAVTPDEASRLLDELARARLLTEHTRGRYAFHDLLRAYAIEQTAAGDIDATGEGDEAIARVLNHYLHTAHRAAILLHPMREPLSLTTVRDGTLPEEPADSQQASTWLEAEHQVLLAAIARAAAVGLDGYAWQLPWTLVTFLDRGGHWQDYIGTQSTALAAARRLGDEVEQARSHRFLGRAYTLVHRYQDAYAHLSEALRAGRHLGDKVSQAHTHDALAWLLYHQQRPAESLEHAEQSLLLYRETGNKAGEAFALNSVGWYCAQTGRPEQALTHCRRALELHREAGTAAGQANTWDSLGYIHHLLGQYADALICYREAVDLFRREGNRYDQADALTHLGDTHDALGEPDGARDAWNRALKILDELDLPAAARLRSKIDSSRPAPEKSS